MKNYRILSLMALVLILALAGGVSSLMLPEAPTGMALEAKIVNASAATGSAVRCVPSKKCGDSPCVPCTPEECAARMGVDVETVKGWMAECKSGSATGVSSVKSASMQCDPSDCPKGADCNPADCQPAAGCNPRTDCKPGASSSCCAARTGSSI